MTNWRASYDVATSGSAVLSRTGRGTLVGTGEDVVPLLQGVVTSDVFRLAAPGAGQQSAAVNATGRLQCEMRIAHAVELLLMDFEPGLVGDAASLFRANVITEDAKFVDRTARTGRICVVGPDAADAIEAHAELAGALRELPANHMTWGTFAGRDVLVQRLDTYGVPAWELWVDVAAEDATTERLDLPSLDEAAAEALRIEAGKARWGAELDEKVIPLEADLDHAISYDKGCYVGQEIIARLDTLGTPAKLLRTLIAEDDAPIDVGATLQRDGKKVGTVRSTTFSPALGSAIALAYVKRDHNDPGTVVELDGRELRVELPGHPFQTR